MAFTPLPLTIIISLISATYFLVKAIKEKHFVRRDIASLNGLILMGNGISLLIFNPALYFWILPLATYPIIQGFIGIGLVVKRSDVGLIVVSSLASLLMTIFIILVQFGLISI